jgi:uncharacterized protein
MIFEWDKVKNRANIRKHGYDFAEAEEMFRGVLIVDADTRHDYGEKRWRALGMIRGRVAHIVFTERLPETIRIISLRKADHEESEEYTKNFEDGLGTH